MTEDDLLGQLMRDAEATQGVISDLGARILAAAWHDGSQTPLLALSSTGAVDPDGITEEVNAVVKSRAVPPTAADQRELGCLLRYVSHHGARGPQPGWSDLRW